MSFVKLLLSSTLGKVTRALRQIHYVRVIKCGTEEALNTLWCAMCNPLVSSIDSGSKPLDVVAPGAASNCSLSRPCRSSGG
jgi:hypothetical protein